MYVNWSYLYRKYLPQSISPFWKITEKTARPNHSLSPKPQIFSTTWCKLHNYFLSWVGAYGRSEAIMQSRAFAKSLIPKWVAQGKMWQLLNLTAAGYHDFKHFLRTSAVYITLPVVFRVSLEILSQEENLKLILQNVSKSSGTHSFYFMKKQITILTTEN